MSSIVDQIERMTLCEKEELLVALKSAIADEIAGAATSSPKNCPRCGCLKSVKKGKGADGTSRRLCLGCGRTFSAKTLRLLARSKLSSSKWMVFAECMADGLALRETAKRVGTTLYTAWFMRMRTCEIMSRRLAPCRQGDFEVDGTYFAESLPGDHSKSGWFALDREPHRTGHDARKGRPGRSGGICVVCGVNEFGDCFCELAGRGTASAADVMVIVNSSVPAGSSIKTDGHPSYGKRSLQGYSHEVLASEDLGMTNSLHSRLKAFAARFNGVSNRRMQRYLDWFRYREQ